MLRKFTKALGRYREGAVHDYPKNVWDKLAKDAGVSLESFSTAADLTNVVHQSPLKGRVRIHSRLGATQ